MSPVPSQPSVAELSQTIGLVDSPPPQLALVDAPLAEAPTDSLDSALTEAEPPDQFTTKPAFYNLGASKAALVGGASLVLFLGVASLFKVASPGENVQPVAEAEAEEAPEDPTLVALRKSKAAESKAKAKLALLDQNQLLEEQQPELETSEAASPVQTADSSETEPVKPSPPKPTPKALPPASPTPVRYSTVTPKPAKAPLPRPTPVTRATPTAPTATPPLFSRSSSRSLSAPDPQAEWQRLAQLGTYGTVAIDPDAPSPGADANVRVAALFPDAIGESAAIQVESSPSTTWGNTTTAVPLSDYWERSTAPDPEITKAAPKTEPIPPDTELAIPDVLASLSLESQSTPDRENQFQTVSTVAESTVLAQTPGRTLMVGSSAQGKLITPVIWAPDGSRGEARFLVRLSQPLLDAQGQEALPSDTQFVVTAQNLDTESGLVDLMVMSLVIGGQEYEAPEGIFSVRDRQGGLLLGQLRNQPNQGRGDTARILTGALAQVGKLMNRPKSTSTSRSFGSFGSSESSTTENDDPNYMGAVLEGGFEELDSVIEERQAAAAAALAKAPQLYQLKAGHPIQIFINQSLSL